jgi:hypothetical protein
MDDVMPDLNEFISTEEAAEKIKYYVEHDRRMLRGGSIEGVKISWTWLVKRPALDGLLKHTSRVAMHGPRCYK